MEQDPESSASEIMVFGMIQQADRMVKAAQGTQRALTEQIQELGQLQEWTVNAAMELQKRADVTIQKLEAERVQLASAQTNLERQAVHAIQGAIRQQSAEIERQTVGAFAAPLRDIRQAAVQVRQNIKESNWLFVAGIFLAGVVIGLFMGYYFVIRTQNTMDDRLNRIEQYLSTPAQPAAAPTTPDPHASTHNGKGK